MSVMNLVEEYPFETEFDFAGDPVGTLQQFQFISCAIKLNPENLTGHENDFFSHLEFIAPFDPEEGELYAQLWKGDLLYVEIQIDEFSEGEPVEVLFDDCIPVDETA